VLDEVGVVRASLLKEPLEVVCGWSCLMLATACDSRGAHHAFVVASYGATLLVVLLVPLLAALSDVPDDGIRHRFPAAAQGWVKLGFLVADGALGGIFDSVGRCLKGL
jgi:hypothetical protein